MHTWIMHTWIPRLLLLSLALPWLAGCGPDNRLQARLQTYVDRLARSLEQPAPAIKPPLFLRLPEPRALQLQVAATRINLLEFLELSQCRLHTVIAETNSSLGKFAVASEILLQELKFLRHVDACITALPTENPLRQLLLDSKQQKLADLPTHLWRATLGGDEFRAFWKTRQDTGSYPQNTDSRTDLALNFLAENVRGILAGHRQLDREQFYAALATLRNNEGGALLQTWQQTQQALQAANQVIANRRAERPLCYRDMVTPSARIFRTVIVSHFVQQVQPDLAILNRRYYDLMPQVIALETLLSDVEPPAYEQWRGQRDQQLRYAMASVPEHIQRASPLLEQCGFLPGT